MAGTQRAKGSFETRDTLTSLMMGTGNVVAGLLLGVVSYWALLWLWQFRLFNLGLSVWVFLAALLLDDLRYYVYHRIAHRVRWVWADHVNHHSSQHCNLSTALRQNWTGLFTFMFVCRRRAPSRPSSCSVTMVRYRASAFRSRGRRRRC